uniref:Uncharacterized protein n=1 Tax=Anguilla anguilla TaxID=7936 RepID=A0A0E9QDX9_ANGAN
MPKGNVHHTKLMRSPSSTSLKMETSTLYPRNSAHSLFCGTLKIPFQPISNFGSFFGYYSTNLMVLQQSPSVLSV